MEAEMTDTTDATEATEATEAVEQTEKSEARAAKRKAHRKSRNGCYQCKQRHTKVSALHRSLVAPLHISFYIYETEILVDHEYREYKHIHSPANFCAVLFRFVPPLETPHRTDTLSLTTDN